MYMYVAVFTWTAVTVMCDITTRNVPTLLRSLLTQTVSSYTLTSLFTNTVTTHCDEWLHSRGAPVPITQPRHYQLPPPSLLANPQTPAQRMYWGKSEVETCGPSWICLVSSGNRSSPLCPGPGLGCFGPKLPADLEWGGEICSRR